MNGTLGCVEVFTNEGAGRVLDGSLAVFGAPRSLDKAIVSTPSSAKYLVYSRDCFNKSSSSIAVGSAFISFSHSATLAGSGSLSGARPAQLYYLIQNSVRDFKLGHQRQLDGLRVVAKQDDNCVVFRIKARVLA
jgi:hypothetical protein